MRCLHSCFRTPAVEKGRMKFKREMAVKVSIAFRKGSLAVLIFFGITSTQVFAAQNEANEQEVVPRTLEVLDVGYKMPIEIVWVRNLRKKKHWLRDLEIEIRNVSAKPVYHVSFNLFLPDSKDDRGVHFGLYLQFGRSELLDTRERSSANDKPIGPGETVIVKVDRQPWLGYENHLIRSVPEQASYKVRMLVVTINFGDGTGFERGGVPYPRDRSMESRPQRYVRILDSR
jgi:hypothetical protein